MNLGYTFLVLELDYQESRKEHANGGPAEHCNLVEASGLSASRASSCRDGIGFIWSPGASQQSVPTADAFDIFLIGGIARTFCGFLPRLRTRTVQVSNFSAVFANLAHHSVSLAILPIDLGVAVLLIDRRRPADAARRSGALRVRGRRA